MTARARLATSPVSGPTTLGLGEGLHLGVLTHEISPDLEHALAVAAELGLRYLEVSLPWDTPACDLEPAQIRRVRELVEAKDMEVALVGSQCFKPVVMDRRGRVRSRAAYEAHVAMLRRVIAVARAWDAPRVLIYGFRKPRMVGLGNPSPILPAGGELPEAVVEGIHRALLPACALAASEGVTLALENVRSCWLNTGRNLARVLGRVNHLALRANWDPANDLVAGGTPYPDGYEAARPWITCVHLKDARILDACRGLARWEPVGEGQVDLAGQLRALVRDGLDVPVLLETHWKAPGVSKEQATRRSAAGLRALLKEDTMAGVRGHQAHTVHDSGHGHGLTRRALGHVTVGAAAAALAACAQDQPSPPATTVGPVTLDFWYHPAAAVIEMVDRNLVQFRAQFPQITIRGNTSRGTGNDPVAMTLTAIAGGLGPDAIYFGDSGLVSYGNLNYLVPLDPLLKQDRAFKLGDIYPEMLGLARLRGQLLGLPYLVGGMATVYNKTLFLQKGVRTPEEYEKEGKWTWDVLLEIVQKLTSGSGETRTVGLLPSFPTQIDVARTWLWPMGGDWFDKDLKRILFTSAESVAAHQFMADLFVKYRAVPLPGEQFPGGLVSGHIGMVMGVRATYPRYDEAPFEKGLVPLPKGKGGRPTRGNAQSFGVMAQSKNRDAAYQLVRFFALAESQKTFMVPGGGIPVRRSLAESREFEQALRPWESVAVYREVAKLIRAPVRPRKEADMNTQHVVPAHEAMRDGKKSARVALEEIKGPVELLLQAG